MSKTACEGNVKEWRYESEMDGLLFWEAADF